MELLIFILMTIGAVLCVFELVAPGFGVFGISGILCLVLSTFLTWSLFEISLYAIMLIQIIITGIVAVIIVVLLRKNEKVNSVILKDTLNLDKNKIDNDELLGKIGVVKTPLKPVGIIKIETRDFEVLSNDGFINIGEEVKVIRVEKDKVFVSKS